MLRIFVLLVALATAQVQAERVFYAQEDAEHHFEQFIATFGKQYASEQERNTRLNIFKENLKKINEQNSMGQAVFGINRFTDLTTEEFKQRYTGRRTMSDPYPEDDCYTINPQIQDMESSYPPLPPFDWRKRGKVSRVKDQSPYCGSCWAFAVTGAIESQYAIKYGNLTEFSEQQLIDCDNDDWGCAGGLQNIAFSWIKNHGGLETEKDYPYSGNDRICKFNKTQAAVQVTLCLKIKNMTAVKLQYELVDIGPLSISVDATDFQYYKSGVLECKNNNQLNHGVLLVGFDKEGDKDFWIIKNSWGDTWGEKGYIRVAMANNSCLVLDDIEAVDVSQ